VSLKLAEGMATMLFGEFRETAMSSLRGRLGGALIGPALRRVRGRLDYRQYGGVPLLGVNGTVFVGHGASDAHAIANALRGAAEVADSGLTQALAEAVRAAPAPRPLADT
jgi:glycerol-3-phosphate acyltransferase PlsX